MSLLLYQRNKNAKNSPSPNGHLPGGERACFFILLFFLVRRVAVHFVARVLRFEEIDELEDVGGAGHPLGRIFRVVVRADAELFEAPVGDVLHVLVHVVRVQSEDAAREKIFVVRHFQVHAFDDDVLDLIGEFFRQQFRILFQNVVDEVHAELEVERFVADDPVDHRAEVAELVALAEREHHHEAAVEPDAFHHDVRRDEVADEIFFAVRRRRRRACLPSCAACTC